MHREVRGSGLTWGGMGVWARVRRCGVWARVGRYMGRYMWRYGVWARVGRCGVWGHVGRRGGLGSRGEVWASGLMRGGAGIWACVGRHVGRCMGRHGVWARVGRSGVWSHVGRHGGLGSRGEAQGSGLARGGVGVWARAGGVGSGLVVIMHSAWPSPVSGQGVSGFPHRAVGAGADGRALVTGAEGSPVHTALSPARVLSISVSPESALGLAGLFPCGFSVSCFPCSLFFTFRHHHCSSDFIPKHVAH